MRYGIYESLNGGDYVRLFTLPYIDEALRLLEDLKESAAMYLRLHDDMRYRFEIREEV